MVRIHHWSAFLPCMVKIGSSFLIPCHGTSRFDHNLAGSRVMLRSSGECEPLVDDSTKKNYSRRIPRQNICCRINLSVSIALESSASRRLTLGKLIPFSYATNGIQFSTDNEDSAVFMFVRKCLHDRMGLYEMSWGNLVTSSELRR